MFQQAVYRPNVQLIKDKYGAEQAGKANHCILVTQPTTPFSADLLALQHEAHSGRTTLLLLQEIKDGKRTLDEAIDLAQRMLEHTKSQLNEELRWDVDMWINANEEAETANRG